MKPGNWIPLILLLTIPAVTWAISAYDVIQLSQAGYSDKQIIELITITGAQFRLDAKSLISLKEAGVRETVIQVMIEANAPRTPSSLESEPNVETSEAHGTDPEHGYTPGPYEVSGASSSMPPLPPSIATEGSFSSYPFQETSGGHGGSHQHYALAVSGLPIFILRSEARYPRIFDRAREAAELLNQIVGEQPAGVFLASSEPNPAVWYRTTDSESPLLLLTVGGGDVIAYQRRSLGIISKDRLAAYWAALLNDYTQLFVFGRAPRDLAALHLGKTLSLIHEKFASPTKGEGKASLGEPTTMLQVLDHLTGEDKEHLLELATRVPAEF